MSDRCRRICGRTNGDCFVGNSRHLSCIADLLINNAGCISSLLEDTRNDMPSGTGSESLDKALSMANDLTNMDDTNVPAEFADFSPHGLPFITPEALSPEALAHCTLGTDHLVRNSLSFTARLMYCNRLHENYMAGGQITEVSSTADVNFFTSIIEFMREAHGDCHA